MDPIVKVLSAAIVVCISLFVWYITFDLQSAVAWWLPLVSLIACFIPMVTSVIPDQN